MNKESIFKVFVSVILIFSPSIAFAGERAFELPNHPIPTGYKTYSLFLINNIHWLMPESENKLVKLFQSFQSFGDAIGHGHLAVWFIEGKKFETSKADTHLYRNIRFYTDIQRSSAICSKLKLPPSKSPYIIITDKYPGECLISKPNSFNLNDHDNYSIIELHNATSAEIINILSKLADQLLINGLNELDPNTEKFWRTLENTYKNVQAEIVSLSKNISLKINTSFFDIEIK